MLSTLQEAETEIAGFISARKFLLAAQVLGQCGKSADAIRKTVEKTEKGASLTIADLREYNKETLAACKRLLGGEGVPLSALEKQLGAIRSSFEKEIPSKVQIAFFPYKASMWDSLESIWIAAQNDPRCECAVVPIPYFDRDPNGLLGTMHDEQALFPKEVPTVEWNRYALEKEQPDIAYIHNPYDEFNLVTSVHPSFYSHEIKKHVGLLVYVPYYATSGGMSEGQSALSAYFHADYIITQSKRHQPFFAPSIPREKLLPLGSPKFDRVIRMAEERPEPPAGWREKMQGKTVYFFNTSIGGLLANTQAFLKKMDCVFRCFQKQKDALLLWRPHPLLASTLHAMRPQFEATYQKLQKEFLASQIGIYDDTPDIETSIAWSDVYIGDAGTSVTSLFGVSGKPQFILNNLWDKEPESSAFETLWLNEKIAKEGKKIWFAGLFDLFELDTETQKCVPLCRLTEKTCQPFADLCKIGDRLFIGPVETQEICVWENGRLRRIPLERHYPRPNAFTCMIRGGKDLYLIPGTYPALVRLDTQTDTLTYYRDFMPAFSNAPGGVPFQRAACMRGNHLFLASAYDDRVVILDTASRKYRIQTVEAGSGGGFYAMADDGKDLWLTPDKGKSVIRWNPQTNETHAYSDYPDGFRCWNAQMGFFADEKPFSAILCFDSFTLLVPYWGNMFIRIDKRDGRITQWTTPFQEDFRPENPYFINFPPFGCTQKTGSHQFMTFSYNTRKLFEVDVETNTCTESQFRADTAYWRSREPGFHYASEWLQYVCFESAFNTLPSFLEGKITGEAFDPLKQKQAYSQICANPDGTCGEKVHAHILRELIKKRK